MWNRISFPNELRALRLFIGAIVVAGCARDNPPPSHDTPNPTTVASQQPAAGADTSCPKSGAWRPCNVLDRLEHAGLVVTKKSEPARVPMFSVEGITYTTTVSTIHVFLYPDQAARQRDTERIDAATVAPRGGTYTWSDPAILVTSNNLAAVVVSPNERQTERIVLALSAGLPPRD
ncbi:MAG: hypothetical protein ACRENH_02890 [Gemmatimonadaceae bacterium]